MCLEAGEALRLRNLFPSFPLLPPHQTLLVSCSVAVQKPAKRAKKYLKLLKPGEEQRATSTLKVGLLKKLRCTLKYEKLAWAEGAQLVAGVDEVGRGALFGPVVAAAVILRPDYRIRGLRDSKLLLPEVREVLAARIREHCIAYAIASVDAARIDEINIYWASVEVLALAVKKLQPVPDHVLVDALKIDVECKQTKIIHGDALSCSIAAASIIAKVERDRWMRDFDAQYPVYGLASNKGYSTPKHKPYCASTDLHRCTASHSRPSGWRRRNSLPICLPRYSRKWKIRL